MIITSWSHRHSLETPRVFPTGGMGCESPPPPPYHFPKVCSFPPHQEKSPTVDFPHQWFIPPLNNIFVL